MDSMKNIDIAAVGEALIDFTPVPAGPGRAVYERNAGGAPANVLAMAGKLGMRTAFIGKVGNDIFGRFLRQTMEREGISVKGLVMSDEYPTTLAFVTLGADGDRSFDFLRKNSADVMLEKDDTDREILSGCRVLHFGSVSLTDSPSRESTLEAVEYAKNCGAVISYDPNYRPLLWKSEEEAVEMMRLGAKYADIIKLSDNETEYLTGITDPEQAAGALLEKGASYVFVTLGPDGCFYADKNGNSGYVPGLKVETADTTGAGDCFTGAALSKLAGYSFSPSGEQLRETAVFANAAAALSTTKSGAIPSMPDMDSVLSLLKG